MSYMTTPTDKDLAKRFLDSDSGRAFRKRGRPWELPDYVREFLRVYAWLEGADDFALEKAVGRVVKTIRSSNAEKAAKTRKRKKGAAKKAEDEARRKAAEPLLPGLK